MAGWRLPIPASAYPKKGADPFLSKLHSKRNHRLQGALPQENGEQAVESQSIAAAGREAGLEGLKERFIRLQGNPSLPLTYLIGDPDPPAVAARETEFAGLKFLHQGE